MNNHTVPPRRRLAAWLCCSLAWLAAFGLQPAAHAFRLTVTDKAGNPIAAGFRWQVEEDNTHHTSPGVATNNTIALSIHRSYAPVVTSGVSADGSSVDVPLAGDKYYYVSVLPNAGASLGGNCVLTNQTEVLVICNALPLPTAQISVLVFEDHNPINNFPDVITSQAERGLSGFRIVLTDNLGQVSQDVFGNPLGTTYQTNALGEFVLDGDGGPIPDVLGIGTLYTDAKGEVQIKNLYPHKYGVKALPPPGSPWIGDTTIEGGPVIDAWVKANEPRLFLKEFLGGIQHAFFGFVNPTTLPWAVSKPNATNATNVIRGTLRFIHFSKPPGSQGFFPGPPVKDGWIGVNDATALGNARGLYATKCKPDGTFVISNVPPGLYQLVNWDEPLDVIIGFDTVTVYDPAAPLLPGQPPPPIPRNGVYDVGNILAFPWFGTYCGKVFYDANQNGFPDPGEPGIPRQVLNLRYRDGSIYSSTQTDDDGKYCMKEVFPYFKWLVAEVDFTRYKATGRTAAIDDGGTIPTANGWTMPSFGLLNPQPQLDNDPMSPSYLNPIINPHTGNNLSKTDTGPYPILLEGFLLFAGQANVIDWGKANYGPGENGGIAGIIYYATTRAEFDPRYAAGDLWEPGIPRVQVNLYTDANNDKIIDDLDGDGVVTKADVDNFPFDWTEGLGSKGPEDLDWNNDGIFDPGDAVNILHSDSWDDNPPTGSQGAPLIIRGEPIARGYDNFSSWNQIRSAVFDGGYQFLTYFPGGLAMNTTNEITLTAGNYIVEAATPPGYEHQKEEDYNVIFGDTFVPSPLLLAPELVGDMRVVPAEYSMFPGEPCFFGGQPRPLPDRKLVRVADGRNTGCDFFMFTFVPKAARCVGVVNNDLAAEFNPNNPIFGEKATPSWIPISFQDWAGNEVAHVYSDEFGGYNALIPSTYSVNVPAPSGVSASMIFISCNHPTMADPNHPGMRIMDPFYDQNYSTTPATLEFWPGKTTYADTPVGPIGSFIGSPNRFLDVEPPSGTPVLHSAVGPSGGPLVCSDTEELLIRAMGDTSVPNPDFTTTNGQALIVTRDFGFGAVVGMVTIGGQMLTVLEWNNLFIRATVPATVTTGSLRVKRGDNSLTTKLGVTVTVGGCGPSVHVVSAAPYPASPIQDAIDAASPGDLILLTPGTYEENVILWKPVKLQGSGAESTILNANPTPGDRVGRWHEKVLALLGEDPFIRNENPGILVLGNVGSTFTQAAEPRIDGLGVTASIIGGGIQVNTHAHYLRISNNKIRANSGFFGGGIVLGIPSATTNVENDHIVIADNIIAKNSGRTAGGILIFAHASDYLITNNCIIGNFGRGFGGGIGHIARSDRGQIVGNQILFNESFNDLSLLGGEGGGIFVGGERIIGVTTPGSGSVTIDRNLIQGNLAGSGDGGGIRAAGVNGLDVQGSPGNSNRWFELNTLNNIIVNNVAAVAGGGISLQDVARAKVVNNTIADNDSSATGRGAFDAGALNSTPQPAGLVSYPHGGQLRVLTGQSFSSPALEDNIFWHNRSYYNDASLNGGRGGLLPNPELFFWDVAIQGAFAQLDPLHSILTDRTGYDASNLSADPLFVSEYTNELFMAVTADEGGNFITVRFAPIGPRGNYHITSGSPAIGLGAGTFLAQCPALARDFDRQTRPDGTFDAGADEYSLLAAPADAGGGPAPGGDLLGPALLVNSHTNGQFLSAGTITLSGVVSDGGRGNSGVASVTVNGEPVTGGTVGGGGIANWSKAVTLVLGPNTFVITATDGSANQNSTAQFITLLVDVTAGPGAIVNLKFNEGAGTFTTNYGTAGGVFTISTPNPAFRTNAAPGTGGSHAIDFGTVTGNFGVDSPAPIDGLRNLVRFTITGWINNRSTSEGGDGNRVVRWFNSSTGGQGADLVYHSDGRLEIAVNRTPNGDARSSSGRIPTSSTAPASNWRFFAVTYDSTLPSGQVQFFFGTPTSDAVFDITRTYSGHGAIGTNIGRLTIGHLNPPTRSGSTSRMLRGLVDEIQIFGNVLTPAEIVRLQRTGSTLANSGASIVRGYPAASATYADTDGIDTDGDGNPTNDVVVLHLAAGDGFVKMADGVDIYTFGFSDVTSLPPEEVFGGATLAANFPAPTITVKEGQKLYLKLSNVGTMMRPDLEDPHSIHYHGFPNAAPVFDGVPENSAVIRMGQTFTYFYNNVTAGTFIYHCHVEATEHMQMGMIGQFYVLPRQNNLSDGTSLRGFTHRTGYKYAYNDGDGSTYYDVDVPLQISGFDRTFHELHLGVQPLPFALMKDNYPMLNGRGYPDTINTNAITNLNGNASQKINALVTANRGQKILLRISSLATIDFHTLTVQGIPMKVIGKGAALLRGPNNGSTPGKNLYYDTSSVTLGGGETADVILDTSRVAAGTYFLYTTRLHHLANDQEDYGGIMTEIVIR